MGKILIFISILILFLMVLRLFKNLKMNFFKFFFGSLGLFTIVTIFFLNPLENMLGDLITNILLKISNFTTAFQVYAKHTILIIDANNGIISMHINYECSGIIELMVFSSLVIFFPFIEKKKKILNLVLGNIYIVVANIIRILFIVAVVKTFGIESYGIAHMVYGRILFFVLMVFLYYRVFTKNQIKLQRVGGIR